MEEQEVIERKITITIDEDGSMRLDMQNVGMTHLWAAGEMLRATGGRMYMQQLQMMDQAAAQEEQFRQSLMGGGLGRS